MRVILIDAKKRNVVEVEINDELSKIKSLLECRTIDAPLVLDNGDTVYCDDEGLFNPRDFIELGDFDPIAGNLLIVGHDGSGGNTDCKSIRADIENITGFIDLATLQLRYRVG